MYWYEVRVLVLLVLPHENNPSTPRTLNTAKCKGDGKPGNEKFSCLHSGYLCSLPARVQSAARANESVGVPKQIVDSTCCEYERLRIAVPAPRSIIIVINNNQVKVYSTRDNHQHIMSSEDNKAEVAEPITIRVRDQVSARTRIGDTSY